MQNQDQVGKLEVVQPGRQMFPIDDLTHELFALLQKREWQIPDITVMFHEYSKEKHEGKLAVSKIFSDKYDFFLGIFNTPLANVHRIVMPRRELTVYDDWSGPGLVYYVGQQWEKDREKFIHGFKHHAWLRGEPKTYLRYEGSAVPDSILRKLKPVPCKYSSYNGVGGNCAKSGQYDHGPFGQFHDCYTRVPPVYLAHTNDLERDYDPQGNEPTYFVLADVFREYVEYFRAILEKIA